MAPGVVPALKRSVGNVGMGLRMQRENGQGAFNVRPDQIVEIAQSGLASLARLGAGAFVSGYRAEIKQDYKSPTADLPFFEFSESLPSIRPLKPLELYEYEACPFCRKVREALTMLDVDAIVYPCPSKGVLLLFLTENLFQKDARFGRLDFGALTRSAFFLKGLRWVALLPCPLWCLLITQYPHSYPHTTEFARVEKHSAPLDTKTKKSRF